MTRQEEYLALKAEKCEMNAMIDIAERDIKEKFPNGFIIQFDRDRACMCRMEEVIQEFKPEMLSRWDHWRINLRRERGNDDFG